MGVASSADRVSAAIRNCRPTCQCPGGGRSARSPGRRGSGTVRTIWIQDDREEGAPRRALRVAVPSGSVRVVHVLRAAAEALTLPPPSPDGGRCYELTKSEDGRIGCHTFGTEITSVKAGGPADAAGLRPGLVLRTVDGARVKSAAQLAAALRAAPTTFTVTAAPAAAPSPPQSPRARSRRRRSAGQPRFGFAVGDTVCCLAGDDGADGSDGDGGQLPPAGAVGCVVAFGAEHVTCRFPGHGVCSLPPDDIAHLPPLLCRAPGGRLLHLEQAVDEVISPGEALHIQAPTPDGGARCAVPSSIECNPPAVAVSVGEPAVIKVVAADGDVRHPSIRYACEPALPKGLRLSPRSGTVGGTPLEPCCSRDYTVWAVYTSSEVGTTFPPLHARLSICVTDEGGAEPPPPHSVGVWLRRDTGGAAVRAEVPEGATVRGLREKAMAALRCAHPPRLSFRGSPLEDSVPIREFLPFDGSAVLVCSVSPRRPPEGAGPRKAAAGAVRSRPPGSPGLVSPQHRRAPPYGSPAGADVLRALQETGRALWPSFASPPEASKSGQLPGPEEARPQQQPPPDLGSSPQPRIPAAKHVAPPAPAEDADTPPASAPAVGGMLSALGAGLRQKAAALGGAFGSNGAPPAEGPAHPRGGHCSAHEGGFRKQDSAPPSGASHLWIGSGTTGATG
eukprot:TRINITY_DN7268_c0_g1_i2.p1 TRINITY_DN7268_c0_g1~~TRINITY_DN7268_c0_g1_i2.p1  ORF type:complete len:698 (+),score=155.31 TRINITY_DN7268_c0_g1_i2:70-2094(+)